MRRAENVIKKVLAVFSCRAHLLLQRIVRTWGWGIEYEHKTWQSFTYSWRLRAPQHRESSAWQWCREWVSQQGPGKLPQAPGFGSSRGCEAQWNTTLTFTRWCRALLERQRGEQRACGGHRLPDLSITGELEGWTVLVLQCSLNAPFSSPPGALARLC